MRLYQVIASLTTGEVYELDLHALDAVTAVAWAEEEIRAQQPGARLTNVHARPVHDSGD